MAREVSQALMGRLDRVDLMEPRVTRGMLVRKERKETGVKSV